MSKRVLIISFDTPYPTNYGGVFDVMAKIAYFKMHGYAVDLISATFEPERVRLFEEFNNREKLIDNFFNLTVRVDIKKIVCFLFSLFPISMIARDGSIAGCSFIKSNKYDLILVEHMKMFPYIDKIKQIVNAPVFLRLHNDECQYYYELARKSRSILKKLFLFGEAIRYHLLQRKLQKNHQVEKFLLISEGDRKIFSNAIMSNVEVLPIFVNSKYKCGNDKATHTPKKYDFCYVGNLDLDDNFQSVILALMFIKNSGYHHSSIMIVGKCSSIERQRFIKRNVRDVIDGCDFGFNISHDELCHVYSSSKVFLNFSTNTGGVKTKLMEALQSNIVVLSNFQGVVNSGLDDLVLLAEDESLEKLKRIIYDNNAREEYLALVSVRFNKYVDRVNDVYDAVFIGGN